MLKYDKFKSNKINYSKFVLESQRQYHNREELIDKYGLRHKCNCGATSIFNIKDEYKICRYCGKVLYKDKKTEFKYTLSKILYK